MVYSEFCQATANGGRQRCVAYGAHVGSHDFQSVTSTSVITINRQEDILRKLTGEEITTAINEAINEEASSVPESDSVPAVTDPAPSADKTTSAAAVEEPAMESTMKPAETSSFNPIADKHNTA